MGYLHVEIATRQSSKKPNWPPGDAISHLRTANSTTVILADGLGSGFNANIAATLCISRFMELIKSGYSVRRAFQSLIKTMNEARGTHMTYAAFTVAHILNDGITTILTYETPPPILVNNRSAAVLPLRTDTVGHALVGEAECYLEANDGLLIVSDGITQAGMGRGLPNGWTIEGVSRFASDIISQTRSFAGIQEKIHQQAREYWGRSGGDDCTAALMSCRWGRVVNILTGPPSSPEKDAEIVNRFRNRKAIQIVCGATTAKVVAKYSEKELEVEQNSQSMLAPPMYKIEGIDLVTEGAITLNQAYNVIDEELNQHEETSGVTELLAYLMIADRINFIVGVALNPASESIGFRQRGILSRA